MTTYARIQGGRVAELFSPPEGHTIDECFAPGLIWVEIDPSVVKVGWSYDGKTFERPIPLIFTVAQQAQSALASGCQVASTAMPALNGTYACDPTAQQKIQATALYIVVNGRFPGGGETMGWADITGAARTFQTTAEFQAFATAIGDYVAGLEAVILGQSDTLPAQPVTIA